MSKEGRGMPSSAPFHLLKERDTVASYPLWVLVCAGMT